MATGPGVCASTPSEGARGAAGGVGRVARVSGEANVIGVIPVRMGSSRFPGKPLAEIAGLSMVEHVYRRSAMAASLDRVIVATPDQEIAAAVEGFGGEWAMTAHSHDRCTDRVAEVSEAVDGDVIVNIQGDEPLVRPEMIDQVVEGLLRRSEVGCANLLEPIRTREEHEDPNRVKVVLSPDARILYYSRAPIPYGEFPAAGLHLRQIGLLAFTPAYLEWFTALSPTPLEQLESIDMIRALEHGGEVLGEIADARLYCVDRPEDIPPVERALADDELFAGYARSSA